MTSSASFTHCWARVCAFVGVRQSCRVENERLKLMTFEVNLNSLCIVHWISYKRTATTYFIPGRESCFIFPCMRYMCLTQDNCFAAQPLFSWDVWLLSLIQGLIPYWTKHFCSLSLIWTRELSKFFHSETELNQNKESRVRCWLFCLFFFSCFYHTWYKIINIVKTSWYW